MGTQSTWGEQSANMGCGASGEPVTEAKGPTPEEQAAALKVATDKQNKIMEEAVKAILKHSVVASCKTAGPCQQEVRLGPIKWADISIRVYYPGSRPLPSPNSHLMLSLSKLHSAVCLLECSRRSATNSLLCSGKPASPLPWPASRSS